MIEGLAACFAGLADPRETSRCDHQDVGQAMLDLAAAAWTRNCLEKSDASFPVLAVLCPSGVAHASWQPKGREPPKPGAIIQGSYIRNYGFNSREPRKPHAVITARKITCLSARMRSWKRAELPTRSYT